MNLLLDTHAWVWWVTRPDKLSRSQRTAIERTLKRSDAVLWISIISCWEVALLSQRGKLQFTMPGDEWLQEACAVPGLEVLPLTLPIVSTAARLDALRDPADMMIVATALHHRARLVTKDARIESAKVVGVIG